MTARLNVNARSSASITASTTDGALRQSRKLPTKYIKADGEENE
ncbi:hypothetical protein [Rhodopirellula baltica]|nr:hypothetical protein [Rhodopirellula baltica]